MIEPAFLNESSESMIQLPIHKDIPLLHSWMNQPFKRINWMNDSVIKCIYTIVPQTYTVCGGIYMQIYSLPDWGAVGGAARRCGQSWPNGSSLSTSRDCKCGERMSSVLYNFNTTTEVPLSREPNPQLLPGRRSINGCPLFQVCVKHRAHIPSMGNHTWPHVTSCWSGKDRGFPGNTVHKAALRSQTLLYQTCKMKWKWHQHFSEDSRFPSEIQCYKNTNTRFWFWNVQCSTKRSPHPPTIWITVGGIYFNNILIDCFAITNTRKTSRSL